MYILGKGRECDRNRYVYGDEKNGTGYWNKRKHTKR